MASGNFEILAPAGSAEQLSAAVNNGCDAVYLGLDSFNARMKAPNFTAQNLCQWVDYCHLFGVRVYVTVNTSVKNDEFADAIDAVNTAYSCLADGVIVTDLSLLSYAASLPKPFNVVASTQLNVHDAYGAKFLKQLGADTVVCSRECTYEQISQIASVGVKVECFLHGALCVCQSGQCLFSSIVGGNSGNRGLCAQPCRKLYKSNEGMFTEGGYLLSAKDICSLDTANKLLNSGVTTFKIEGRNRRPEYSGAASKVYSKLFRNDFHYDDTDYNLLAEMFNRGNLPSCSYLDGKNDDLIFTGVQNHIGVNVGVVKNGCVCGEVSLKKGDGLKVFDKEREWCGGTVVEDGVGIVRAKFSAKVKDGMTVRRTTSQQLCNEILSARRKLPLRLQFNAQVGSKARLTLVSGEIGVIVESEDILQSAITKATDKAEFARQLARLGDAPFELQNLAVECGEVFMAKSQINALRRKGLEILRQSIVETYNDKFASRILPRTYFCGKTDRHKSGPCLAVVCSTKQQIKDICDKVDYILYKPEMIDVDSTSDLPSNCYVDLPPFSDVNYVRKLLGVNDFGIVCNNVGQVQLAREAGVAYIAGSGLNLFNDEIVSQFNDCKIFVYSQELTLKEISEFKNGNGLIFVDGKISLMKLVHCPYKVVFGCTCSNCKANRRLVYTDELANGFEIVRRRDKKCNFELYNGKKLSVLDKLQVPGRYCVDFDNAIVEHYLNLNNGIVDDCVETAQYTRGRLYKKVY